jgi:protein TonB
MFEDFATSISQQQTQKRLRRSMAIAATIYISAGAALVSATNKARELVKEHLTQIEFAQPEAKPEPKPEPPPPVESAKPKSARAGVSKRTALKPPDQMPSEKPAESDAPLVAATETGGQDGVLGEVGGTGKDSVTAAAPPAPTAPPKLVPPKELPGNQQPGYPTRAERDQLEGEVLVSFDVLEDGSVANPKIVKGPEVFHEAVLRTALTWRYRPATLAGKPVKQRHTKLVAFRLED